MRGIVVGDTATLGRTIAQQSATALEKAIAHAGAFNGTQPTGCATSLGFSMRPFVLWHLYREYLWEDDDVEVHKIPQGKGGE